MSIKPKVPIKLLIVGQKPIDREQIALRKFVSSTAPRPTQWSPVLPEAWIKATSHFSEGCSCTHLISAVGVQRVPQPTLVEQRAKVNNTVKIPLGSTPVIEEVLDARRSLNLPRMSLLAKILHSGDVMQRESKEKEKLDETTAHKRHKRYSGVLSTSTCLNNLDVQAQHPFLFWNVTLPAGKLDSCLPHSSKHKLLPWCHRELLQGH